MALRKQITLESGIAVEYWRVAHLSADLVNRSARVTLLAYRDAAARNAGRQPVHDATRVVELSVDGTSDLRLAALYRFFAAERREREPARRFRDPGTGRDVEVPAVVEEGFLFGAEDV